MELSVFSNFLHHQIEMQDLIVLWIGWMLCEFFSAFFKEWVAEFKKVRRNRRINEALVRAEAVRREKEKDLAVMNAMKKEPRYPL